MRTLITLMLLVATMPMTWSLDNSVIDFSADQIIESNASLLVAYACVSPSGRTELLGESYSVFVNDDNVVVVQKMTIDGGFYQSKTSHEVRSRIIGISHPFVFSAEMRNLTREEASRPYQFSVSIHPSDMMIQRTLYAEDPEEIKHLPIWQIKEMLQDLEYEQLGQDD